MRIGTIQTITNSRAAALAAPFIIGGFVHVIPKVVSRLFCYVLDRMVGVHRTALILAVNAEIASLGPEAEERWHLVFPDNIGIVAFLIAGQVFWGPLPSFSSSQKRSAGFLDIVHCVFGCFFMCKVLHQCRLAMVRYAWRVEKTVPILGSSLGVVLRALRPSRVPPKDLSELMVSRWDIDGCIQIARRKGDIARQKFLKRWRNDPFFYRKMIDFLSSNNLPILPYFAKATGKREVESMEN